jgi:beta-mannosidase
MNFNLFIFVMFFCFSATKAANAAPKTFLKWELGYAKTSGETPAKWIPAVVPGAVQLDIARAEKYAPYFYDEHWKDYLWMEDQFYTYRTNFSKPELATGERLVFISKGIDYEFSIFLNGEEVLHQEGMFTPVSIDMTEKLKENNELKIRINPVPKNHATPVDRSQAKHVAKPAVSYGWDWHPRLIPLGIWDETYLEIQPASHIDDFYVNYTLNSDFTKADIKLEISGKNLANLPFVWTLKDATGKVVLKSEGKTEISFSNPQ